MRALEMGNTALSNSSVPEHQVLAYFAGTTKTLINQTESIELLWKSRAEKETL
jgi:hypothetical protein